jgi:murein DD-endopeptidase MepM/ murein hydrolase activator NlpD
MVNDMNRLQAFYKLFITGTLLLLVLSAQAKDHPIAVTFVELPDGQQQFYAENKEPIPYTIKITFPEIKNMTVDKALPFYSVLPAHTKKLPLFRMKTESGKQGSFQYAMAYYAGDYLSAKHDKDHAYLIPYKHGTKHKVTQAYDGGASHVDDTRYAIDFLMPEGTGIYATRSGIVSDVKEDSNIGGTDKKYLKHGNYISIYHEDGSFANYSHLKLNGAIVKKGDRVKAGTLIGYSGNTGLSNGPHLHFEIRLPDNKTYRTVTIPTKFLNFDGKAITIQPCTWHYATHHQQPKYTVHLGRLQKSSNFEHYQAPFASSDKVDVRYEQVDDTYILFAGNGYNETARLTVKLELPNMIIEQANPVLLDVPPGQERFLCLIRARSPKNPTDHQFRFKFSYDCKYTLLPQ